MRYSQIALRLLLTALFLLHIAVATSPSQFQRMDNLPNLDCTTAWNTDMPYCHDSDFENGAPCRSGCAYGVESTQEGIQQVCQGAQYAPGSLMAAFMAGTGAAMLCPNVVTTTPVGGSGTTALSVSTVSRPTSLAFTTAVASSTVTVTSKVTSSLTSSTTSSSSAAPKTTVVVHSTVVTHVTTTPSSTSNATSTATSTVLSTVTSTATSSASSIPSSSSSSTTAPTTSRRLQTATGGATVTVQSTTTSGTTPTAVSGASVTVQGVPSSGTIQTAVSVASVTIQGGASSSFLQTAVNGGSATVLSSKPAQTSSNNPDAFGGGGSPFEISSPASRSRDDLQCWTTFLVVGCMIWSVWV